MKELINLGAYLWQSVLVTYRDGNLGVGVIHPTSLHNYPFKFASKTSSGERNHSYTESGQVLMSNESKEDIVSIRPVEKSKTKVKNNLNLEQYLCGRVRVTYRDGSQAEGRLGYTLDEVTKERWPFKFFPTDNSLDEETYTEYGQVYFDRQNEKDIVKIEDLHPNQSAEPGSAVEKMALALLPAIFTSLESDPNLDYAIETAIRSTFLAMFGDDVTGETLDHSVSVIKSRICLSLKQC